MGRKSIEDVMNEIEDFLNSCKTTALSSNKVVVPRDEFDELFGDLKVKIPAEIDRCKKIMRNKEAILMDARKNADGILAQAGQQANQMISETEIMKQANQKAYETVEMARVQANEILAQAVSEANEIRLGSMQYTNDIMMGIRNYVEATMEAERVNYENLIEALNNDYLIANANLDEIQNQIVEFTGNPDSVQRVAPKKMETSEKTAPKAKTSMVQKVKQAVGMKDEKSGKSNKEGKRETQPDVNIPDFISSGEKVVPNETPLAATDPVQRQEEQKPAVSKPAADKAVNQASTKGEMEGNQSQVSVVSDMKTAPKEGEAGKTTATASGAEGTKKVKKKIVKRRNPVIHTPQTAQETVAKTLEAAAAVKMDKTVYKANGEQAREIPPMEGRVKRGPRVGRGMVEEHAEEQNNLNPVPAVDQTSMAPQSLGVIDDFSAEEKF